MKTVTMDAEQYGQIVYLAVATTPSDDFPQLRLAAKVLTKLEEKGVRKPTEKVRCPRCQGDITELVSPSARGGYQLVDEEAEFSFEDAEAEFIVKRVETMVPKLQTWAAVKALPVIDQLQEEAA